MMDITFRNPQYWWLCAAILPSLSLWRVWMWRRSSARQDAYMPPAKRIFERTSRAVQEVVLWAGMSLLMALAILGVMHPERTVTVMESVYEHALTVAVFDTSSSIKAEAGYFGEGGRLGAIKQAFRELLAAEEPPGNSAERLKRLVRWLFGGPALTQRVMEGQRMGMVRFAGEASIAMKPTARQQTLSSAVRLLESVPLDTHQDGTNFPAAIEAALMLFQKDDAVRVILFFTDGDEEEGNALSIEPMLAKAREMHVKIFPVVVGKERAPVPGRKNTYSAPAWEDCEKNPSSPAVPCRMAIQTGGKAFRFNERGKLYGHLQRVFAQVTEATKEPVKKKENLQPWCAAILFTVFVFRTLAQYLIPGKNPHKINIKPV